MSHSKWYSKCLSSLGADWAYQWTHRIQTCWSDNQHSRTWLWYWCYISVTGTRELHGTETYSRFFFVTFLSLFLFCHFFILITFSKLWKFRKNCQWFLFEKTSVCTENTRIFAWLLCIFLCFKVRCTAIDKSPDAVALSEENASRYDSNNLSH